MIQRLQRTFLAALGRPRRLQPAAPPTPTPTRTWTRPGTNRTDLDRRLDAARQRLKSTIPPPPE